VKSVKGVKEYPVKSYREKSIFLKWKLYGIAFTPCISFTEAGRKEVRIIRETTMFVRLPHFYKGTETRILPNNTQAPVFKAKEITNRINSPGLDCWGHNRRLWVKS